MPSCGTYVAAAIVRGELDQVPADVGYLVIPFNKLYDSWSFEFKSPKDLGERLILYLQTQRQCESHTQELVPTTGPCKSRKYHSSRCRWSYNLIVPVFYLLQCAGDPVKLLRKCATLNPIKRWVHVIPQEITQKLDPDYGLEIRKSDNNILYAIANFQQANLFEAMLDIWPTLTTQPLSFDWDFQWSDNISQVIFDRLHKIDYLLIAIRHGLDVNIIPDYHVLDMLLINALYVSTSEPYPMNLMPLLVTYGLTDFSCEADTPMRFILHFTADQECDYPDYNWRGTEIYFAMVILESVGYQYMLPEGLIEIERALKKKWVDRPRKAELMQEHLDRIMNHPLTLTEISRNKIRSNLGGSYLCIKATQLGLPPALVKVVTMEDIRNSLLFDGRSPAEI